MKKLIFIFAALMALGACQEKNQSTTAMPSDADSIYTYQYIKMHFVKEPERCLGLLTLAIRVTHRRSQEFVCDELSMDNDGHILPFGEVWKPDVTDNVTDVTDA